MESDNSAALASPLTENLNFDILRDSADFNSQEWLNRSCQNTKTKALN
jgi:hypothetical protein